MTEVWQLWPCPNLGITTEDSIHETHPKGTLLEASPHLELLFRPPGSFQPQVSSQVTSVFLVAFVEISGLEISVVGQTHERRSLFCTWLGFPQDFHSLGSLQGILGGWECLRTSEISLAGVVWIMDGDTLIHKWRYKPLRTNSNNRKWSRLTYAKVSPHLFQKDSLSSVHLQD